MAQLLKGMEVANGMKAALIEEVDGLKAQGVVPQLAIVRLGERPDDLAYERGAIKRLEGVGVVCTVHTYPETIEQEALVTELKTLDADDTVDGILLFRPLPKHIDDSVVKYAVSPQKDVDASHPANLCKLFEGDKTGFAPCTPEGVIALLKHYKISLSGKKVTLIGRSLIVGKPLFMLLLQENATVTVCHTRTKDLAQECRNADIIIAAAGSAKMITQDFVKPGQIVIDVGMNVDKDGNLCGDVDFGTVEPIVDAITPVPGGTGSVTTSILAKHVITSAKRRLSNR